MVSERWEDDDEEMQMDSSHSDRRSNPRPESHPITSSSTNGGSSASNASRLAAVGIESSAVLIVPERLSGDNYREWAQSMRLTLAGRGKLEHITGETAPPPSSDVKALKVWQSENAMVSSWLVNTMLPTIKRIFMYLPSAPDIWEAAREAYSDGENASQIFDIKNKLWDLKQGTQSVSTYYLEKILLWQELDLISEADQCCASHAATNKKKIEKERLFELLAGLNVSFDDIRGRILSQDPLSSVQEAFAILRREESCKKVMLKEDPLPRHSPSESSALAVRSAEQRNNKRPTCDYCKKTGHTKDSCWDLHGKPPDWKPKRGRGRGYVAEISHCEEPAPSPLGHSDDQLSQILERLAALESSQQPCKQPIATVMKRGSTHGDDDWHCKGV